MESNAKTKPKGLGKGILWIMVGVFVLQLCAWGAFIFFAHKTNTQEIKVERPREAAAT